MCVDVGMIHCEMSRSVKRMTVCVCMCRSVYSVWVLLDTLLLSHILRCTPIH